MHSFARAYAGHLPLTAEAVEPEPQGQGHFPSVAALKQFALAGNATLTVRSLKTGAHFTYNIRQAEKTEANPNPAWFVRVLGDGDRWVYLGMLREPTAPLLLTKASKANADSPSVRAFTFTWAHLQTGRLPEQLEVRHDGHCGRCSRTLTNPDSLDLGIGPDCAEKMGLR